MKSYKVILTLGLFCGVSTIGFSQNIHGVSETVETNTEENQKIIPGVQTGVEEVVSEREEEVAPVQMVAEPEKVLKKKLPAVTTVEENTEELIKE